MRKDLEGVLLSALGEESDRPDLNRFYKRLNDLLREQLIGGGGDRDTFESLLRLRTFPPLIALSVSDPRSCEWRDVRVSSLKVVVEEEKFNKIAENINKNPKFYNKAKSSYELLRKGEGDWEITIQVLEVGSIQELVRRNGALREMRGASLLVDVIPRYASTYLAERLGEEFILTRDAGELVFISSPKVAEELEGELLRHIREIPIANDLILKGNGKNVPILKAKDLLSDLGSCYLLALSSAKEITSPSDRIEMDPSKICGSCRADKILDGSSVDCILNSFSPSEDKVRWLKSSIRTDEGICQSCLILASYGLILTDILKSEFQRRDVEKEWNGKVVQAIKESSSYRIFRRIGEEITKKGRNIASGFIKNLEDYDYPESNALISMISADGDGFGSLKSEAESLMDFIALSILFSSLMEEGLISGAIRSVKLEELISSMRTSQVAKPYDFLIPITPLYAAGDDMLLILRAEHVVSFVRGLAARVKEIISRARELGAIPSDRRIGISLGVTVARTKVPAIYLYDTSHMMMRYTKDVIKGMGLQRDSIVQASILYAKQASWGLPEKFRVREGSDIEGLWRSIIWIGTDESPILKAFDTSIGCDGGAITSSDLKEVMEDLLSEAGGRMHYELALLRWLSDIARGLDSERSNVYECMKEVYRYVVGGRPSPEVWRALYTLSTLLSVLEDRLNNELGGDVRENLSKLRGDLYEGNQCQN
ncbi:MAG: hypothetical protein QXH90_06610 [Candidatus Korarchaeum sp.]